MVLVSGCLIDGFLLLPIAKNGNVSPVSSTSSNPSTPVTPTSPVSKLPVEESSSSITSNGSVPKSNGSVKSNTNTENKSEKGNYTNNTSNPTNEHVTFVAAELRVPSNDDNDINHDDINPVTDPEQSTTPSTPQNAAEPPVNGVETVVAATHHSDSANLVIEPSTPSALPDSSTTPSAASTVEGSVENAPPSAVNGVNAQSNDGADKDKATTATSPSSPEKEEPGTLSFNCAHIHSLGKLYICKRRSTRLALYYPPLFPHTCFRH